MKKFFSVLWKRPVFNDMTEERKVDWIELFYDLVFIVLISRLAHTLILRPAWDTIIEYTFLFLAVWFTWISSVYYHDLAKVEGIRIIVFTFIKMLSVGMMTLFIHGALGENSTGFASGYILHHGLMSFLFYRLLIHNKNNDLTRGLPVPVIFYGISTGLFAISLLFPIEYRLYFWGIALFIDFLMPLAYTYKMGEKSFRGSPRKLKMMERFGLFTIIVLGEGIISIFTGLSEHHFLSVEIMVAGFIQFILIFTLWYIYFRTVEKRSIKQGVWWRQFWTYLHFIMFTCMIMIGASMLYLIEHYHSISGGKIYLTAFGITMIVFAVFELCLEKDVSYKGRKVDFYLIFSTKLIGGVITLLMGLINVRISAMMLLIIFLGITSVVVYFMLREYIREELYLLKQD
ncbi:MAG: low temperature requirement protein A [Bacillota bacterium]